MKRRTLGIIFTLCAVMFLAQPTRAMMAPTTAEVLAIWDFGPESTYYTQAPAYYNTVAEPTLEIAGGEKDTNGKNGIAYTDAGGIDHIAGQAAAWDDIKVSGVTNAYWIVTIDTTGYSSLTIRWDYKSELATHFDLAYRTSADGEWIQLVDNYDSLITGWDDDAWYSVTLDLSGCTELNNQSFLQFRVDDLEEGTGNKKFAFDNLEITGVPEPTTLLLLGLGAMLLKKTKH